MKHTVIFVKLLLLSAYIIIFKAVMYSFLDRSLVFLNRLEYL